MKERKKKLIALLAASAMSISVLAACGSSQPAAAPAAPAEPAAEAAEEVVEEAAEEVEEAAEETVEEAEEAAEEGEEAAEEVVEEAEEAVEEAVATDSTPRNETLYFAGQQWGTINDWNPFSANSNNAMAQTQKDDARVLVYETLFMFNQVDGSLRPLVGSSYEWNEDNTVLTVKLNPDAKWANGRQIVAEDYVYTYNTHVKYEDSIGMDFPTYIESMEAPDDETIVITAKLNDDGVAVNPLKVTNILGQMYILDKEYLQKVEARNNEDKDAFKTDDMKDFGDEGAYSGPYRDFIANDQKVVLIRDDNYWGQAESMWGKLPVPKYIAHTIYKDNAAGQVALSQGEVDVCQQFITDVQDLWLEQDLPISTWFEDAPYGMTATMPSAFFNTRVEGLDQKEVRKAIAMAVDYEQIISSAMSGQSQTFDDLPRAIVGPLESERKYIDFDKLADLNWKNADVEGANALLDEAGIVDSDGDGIREYNGKNLSFKAECPSGWSDWNASMEIIAAAGKNIGIDITTYFPDAPQYYDDFTNGKFDICMWSAPGASVMSPWSKAMFYFSEQYGAIESGNWSGNFGAYMNDEAEEILQAIPLETDEAKLTEYYTRLTEIWLEDVPSVALMYRPSLFYAVNESVWTNYPAADDGRDIPPTDCTDGYGIAALYELELVEE